MPQTIIAHLAHPESDQSPPRIQSLQEHSQNVARLCADLCQIFGLKKLGELTGALHDPGKAAEEVQQHIQSGSKEKVNHSAAGMRWIWEQTEKAADSIRLTGQLASLAIGCHHSGRCDYLSPEGSSPWIQRMYSKQAQLLYPQSIENFFAHCWDQKQLKSFIQEAAQEVKAFYKKTQAVFPKGGDDNLRKDSICFAMGLTQRFLFSALIDADWTDTACFMSQTPLPVLPTHRQRQETWNLLSRRMEEFLHTIPAKRPIDLLRQEISNQCFSAAENRAPGIYRLYVPTGGGKTYSGLRFCLEMARRQNAQHLFYFAPYKSITRQNADCIRAALGEEFVLEHHSDVLFQEDPQNEKQDRWLALSQRWQGVPVICTTMVQLLNTLFASPRQNVRRLSALAGSVLLLDEVQALALQHTCPMTLALNTLAKLFGCTIVLCTATQPDLTQIPYPLMFSKEMDLVPDYQLRFEQFRRTKILPPAVPWGQSIKEIADFVAGLTQKHSSILIILNVKKKVNELFSALKTKVPADFSLFCLTTYLCQQHRNDQLKQIARRLKENQPVICISTQLMEAGVDLSFDCVVRDLAGLPSIIQAAGRCNRHGENGCRPVYLIECAGENLDKLPEIYDGREITRTLLAQLPKDAELLSPEIIQKYYQLYYDKSQHKLDMQYRIEKKGYTPSTMVDLLCRNAQGVGAFRDKGGKLERCTDLCQAFGTAEEAFQAIPDETVPVLVFYGEGKEKLLKLLSSQGDPSLLKQLQPYTVSISHSECKSLGSALSPVLDGAALVLAENYYDSQSSGLSFEPLNTTAIFI